MTPPSSSLGPNEASAGSGDNPLAALAHPLRSRVLGQLRELGTATATDLAARLGTNSGATSYHLRKLADAGLVEDTGDGTGRRRVWRAVSAQHSWRAGDVAGDEDAESVLNWLERDYVTHLSDRSNRWLDDQASWPLEWRDALGIHDDHVVATAEQVREMGEEIRAVVQRFRRAGMGNPTARRVSVWTVMYPIDLDRPPRR